MKGNKMKGKVCSKCSRAYDAKKGCKYCLQKTYRAKYPYKYKYDTLRVNAKRRGLEFTLTLEQFIEFARPTELMYKRGRHKDSLTVERINPLRGYTIDNLEVLTKSENSRKGATNDKKILNVYKDGGCKSFSFERENAVLDYECHFNTKNHE